MKSKEQAEFDRLKQHLTRPEVIEWLDRMPAQLVRGWRTLPDPTDREKPMESLPENGDTIAAVVTLAALVEAEFIEALAGAETEALAVKFASGAEWLGWIQEDSKKVWRFADMGTLAAQGYETVAAAGIIAAARAMREKVRVNFEVVEGGEA